MLLSQAAGTHQSRPRASVTVRLELWQPVSCSWRRSRLLLTECDPMQITTVAAHSDNGTGIGKGTGPQLLFRNRSQEKEIVKVSCRPLYLQPGPNHLSGSQPVHRD